MSNSTESSNSDIPVVCGVCGTRNYAKPSQIGQKLRCPDCHTENLVKESPPITGSKPEPRYTGHEYQLLEDPDSTPKTDPALYTRVTCQVCHTIMNVRIEHVGKRVQCPDCDTPNPILPPVREGHTFEMPDVQDVVLEKAPPPVDASNQRIADRLMSKAFEELEEAEAEQPPISPEQTKLIPFVLQLKIIPVWFITAIGMLLISHLVDLINNLMATISLESILAVFVTIITVAFATAIAGFVAPQLLAITAFTSEGYDRIPYWPSHDVIDRGKAILLIVNAVGMAAAPGMLFATLLRPFGVPWWAGLLPFLFPLPFILLSQMDNDSAFLPYSAEVHSSLSKRRPSWNLFYLQSIGLFSILAFPTALCWLLSPSLGRFILCFAGAIYLVIYAFLLGRLTWMIGNVDSEDDPQEPRTSSQVAK